MLSRVLQLVESSEAKEHVYQVAGDLVVAAPHRLEVLEKHLDRTSYALSVLGEESLRDVLPLADRKVVDEAVERARPLFGPQRTRSSGRVADAYLARQADLHPPLGGGPCMIIDRARTKIRTNPTVMQEIVDDVEEGIDLSNAEAAKIYPPFTEKLAPGSIFDGIYFSSHEQYRMDLRKITVAMVRAAIEGFLRSGADPKTKGTTLVKWMASALESGQTMKWLDPRTKVEVVFKQQGRDLVLITSYVKGRSDPSAPGDGGCDG
jgi:hypothetical protein